MKCHIVYLKPVGAGGFKAPLRSDTLWGTLCWAIRMVEDESTLEGLITTYDGENPEKAFYVSSAFIYRQGNKKKTHFLPAPLLPGRSKDPITSSPLSPFEIKSIVRKEKEREKLQTYLPQSHFEYIIGGEKNPDKNNQEKLPGLVNRPMTHNTIDRLIGSTLDLNGSGQLFHTDEQYLIGEDTGLFFLVSGNVDAIRPALRYLGNEGIGGDRSTGKGRFSISEPEEFEIKTPSEPNAQMTLSLYHPTSDELDYWSGNTDRVLNYNLEDRLGRTHLQKKYLHDKPLIFFKEGSVFPEMKDRAYFGKNEMVGTHDGGFQIRRYGYGFMIDVKIL